MGFSPCGRRRESMLIKLSRAICKKKRIYGQKRVKGSADRVKYRFSHRRVWYIYGVECVRDIVF